jgi:hypothetical protein
VSIYIGSVTIPFRDFSYVLKVQCPERGTTGIRDTIVADQLMREGKIRLPDAAGRIINWLSDPYTPTAEGPMTRNRSEVEEYDAKYPDHPLSRARAILRHLEATTRVSDEIRNAHPFKFQSTGPKKQRWWKMW